MRRRGLTTLELVLALLVTTLVGLGVASMLSMVSAGEAADREGRSVLLRAHAAQVRLRAYFNPAKRAMEYRSGEGLSVWLHDQRDEGLVNLSELRIIWTDAADGTMRVEWVDFPDDWTETQILTFDAAMSPDADFFAVMATQRAAGMTASMPLVDGLASADMSFQNAGRPNLSERVFVRLRFTGDPEERETVAAFGLSDYVAPGG